MILGGALNFETFENVLEAQNLGFELEARRNLSFLSEGLEDWNVIFNYAFVDSEISIDPDTSATTNDQRPLVGQPDNIANLIVEWNKPESGTTVRLLFNHIDDKVALAGGFGLPDVVENARDTFDVVWGQELDRWAPGLRFKLSGQNLSDEERLWTQGDGTFRRYEPGRSISLSFSYNPFTR